MGRGSRPSSGSRSSGGTTRISPSGGISIDPIDRKVDIGIRQDEEGKIQGGIGGDVNRSGNSPFSPNGNSPFDPPGKPKAPGSNIDLGKDPPRPDFPDKPKPGGGAGIGVEVFGSPDGNLGIGISAPIGTTGISARGGVFFDPKTGKPIGGQGGIGAGIPGTPIDVTIDGGVDAGGCIRFVTIGFGPFSHTFQGNVCKPNEPPKPPGGSPSPSPSPGSPNTPGGPIDPGGVPDGVSCDFAFIEGDFVDSCRYAWGDETDRQVFVEEGGGYASLSSSGSDPYWVYEDGGYVSCGFNPESPCSSAPTPTPSPPGGGGESSLDNSPLPNTPPQKEKDKKMDTCCQFLAALIAAHGMNISNLLGQEVDLFAQPKKAIFPLEIERIQTPKNPRNPRARTKKTFGNYFDLLNYLLNQQVALDTALDPQAWNLIPDGDLFMNPEYERPSDITLKENREPSQDKAGNDRTLKVGDKIFFPSVLAEQRWMFEKLKQLDYLFPPGELADAKISKDLLMPGQKGELKIFNLIHAYEILLQYLSAILGDPREQIIIKDANPAMPGDQGVKVSHMSISHLIRELYKFTLDTEGDVDALMMMGLRDFRTNLANRVQLIQVAEMVEALFEDSGMLEKQQYIKIALEGDPYAGQWKEGKGFEPDPELDKDTEEATEAVLVRTLNNTELKVKVSRRDPKEKTDMRDLLVELAKTVMRQNSIPATPEAVQKAIESAEFKTKVDMALIRQQVKLAQAQSSPRTRKKRKK